MTREEIAASVNFPGRKPVYKPGDLVRDAYRPRVYVVIDLLESVSLLGQKVGPNLYLLDDGYWHRELGLVPEVAAEFPFAAGDAATYTDWRGKHACTIQEIRQDDVKILLEGGNVMNGVAKEWISKSG